MADQPLRLKLSAADRRLLLTYTYPFDKLLAQLKALDAQPGKVLVTMEVFDLEHLLADLVYSAKRIRRAALLEQIDELYTDLENQARRQGVIV
ncbi:MAG: hypothetical protein M3Z21_03965 [Pseudomonadota bacterium]|nr:hypothetical protein [Pseudomonadota bacterium]